MRHEEKEEKPVDMTEILILHTHPLAQDTE